MLPRNDGSRAGEAMSKAAREGITYSAKICGARGNYHWPVSFDIDGGYVGINQYEYSSTGNFRRILLSPLQVKELIAFVKRHGVKP